MKRENCIECGDFRYLNEDDLCYDCEEDLRDEEDEDEEDLEDDV